MTKTPQQVWIIDEAFYMPQLDRWRRIWVCLPPDYDTSDKTYPVLYMHDGQNLFEDWAAFGEEWEVDETLRREGGNCIVVGIDNGAGHRTTEYNMFDHPAYGRAEGAAYMEFIVCTLKPYIDRAFATRPDREHTYMAGSSMGGLISLFGGMKHAAAFGKLGVFSPSLWLVPELAETVTHQAVVLGNPVSIYFYSGALEACDTTENTDMVAAILKEKGQDVIVGTAPEGTHSEHSWRQAFPDFYRWLRASPSPPAIR